MSSCLMLKFSDRSLLAIDERLRDRLLKLGLWRVELMRLSAPSDDISYRLSDIFRVFRVALD